MAQAVAAIRLNPNWQRIEITEEKPASYRLQLYYKPLGQRHSPVVSRAEATADTKEIAGAVLDELKKEGMDPAKDRINVSVGAQQDAGKGMTGSLSLGPLVGLSTTTSRIDWNTARSDQKVIRLT
jgi:hypothetical protein